MSDALAIEAELEHIVKIIDNMDKLQHIEIGKILMKDQIENNVKIEFNEKKDGLRINLTRLSPSVIEKIKNYIDRYKNINDELSKLKETSEEIKNIYFN